MSNAVSFASVHHNPQKFSYKGYPGHPSMNQMMKHNERDLEKYKKVKHSNQSIDEDRTSLNYPIVRYEGKSYRDVLDDMMDSYKERGEWNGRENKDGEPCANVVTMIETTVNLSGEALKMTLEESNKFYEDFVDWFRENHNSHIISAVVHNDETNPGLHIMWAPIQDGRLCESEIHKQADFHKLQDTSLEYLQEKYPEFGFRRKTPREKVMNGMTKEQYTEYRRIQEEVEEAWDKIHKSEADLAEVMPQVEALKEQYKKLLESVEERENNVLVREANVIDREADVLVREVNVEEQEQEVESKKTDVDDFELDLIRRNFELKEKSLKLNKRESKISERESKVEKRERDISNRSKDLDKRESDIKESISQLEAFRKRGQEVLNGLADKWKSLTNVGMRNKLKRNVERFLPLENELTEENVEKLDNLEHILNSSDFDGLQSDNDLQM